MRQHIPNTNGTYDAIYNKVHIGTYSSNAQALAATRGVATYLAALALQRSPDTGKTRKTLPKGVYQRGKRFATKHGSFPTLAEALESLKA